MINRIISWIDGTYHLLYIGVGSLIIFTIFAFLANRWWGFFKGGVKKPLWLERMINEAKNLTSFPRSVLRVLFIHPLKLIEEIEITFIILAQKLRSRVALLIIALWTVIFIVVLKPNADFNLFVGLGTLIGASTFIMLRFMGMSQEDKKMQHEKMTREVKGATEEHKENGGDSA